MFLNSSIITCLMYWTLTLRDFTQLWDYSNLLCSPAFIFLRGWVFVTALSSFCPLKCFAMSCYHFLYFFCFVDVCWESIKWNRTVCVFLARILFQYDSTSSYLLIGVYPGLQCTGHSHVQSQCFMDFQLLIFLVWSWDITRPIGM